MVAETAVGEGPPYDGSNPEAHDLPFETIDNVHWSIQREQPETAKSIGDEWITLAESHLHRAALAIRSATGLQSNWYQHGLHSTDYGAYSISDGHEWESPEAKDVFERRVIGTVVHINKTAEAARAIGTALQRLGEVMEDGQDRMRELFNEYNSTMWAWDRAHEEDLARVDGPGASIQDQNRATNEIELNSRVFENPEFQYHFGYGNREAFQAAWHAEAQKVAREIAETYQGPIERLQAAWIPGVPPYDFYMHPRTIGMDFPTPPPPGGAPGGGAPGAPPPPPGTAPTGAPAPPPVAPTALTPMLASISARSLIGPGAGGANPAGGSGPGAPPPAAPDGVAPPAPPPAPPAFGAGTPLLGNLSGPAAGPGVSTGQGAGRPPAPGTFRALQLGNPAMTNGVLSGGPTHQPGVPPPSNFTFDPANPTPPGTPELSGGAGGEAPPGTGATAPPGPGSGMAPGGMGSGMGMPPGGMPPGMSQPKPPQQANQRDSQAPGLGGGAPPGAGLPPHSGQRGADQSSGPAGAVPATGVPSAFLPPTSGLGGPVLGDPQQRRTRPGSTTEAPRSGAPTGARTPPAGTSPVLANRHHTGPRLTYTEERAAERQASRERMKRLQEMLKSSLSKGLPESTAPVLDGPSTSGATFGRPAEVPAALRGLPRAAKPAFQAGPAPTADRAPRRAVAEQPATPTTEQAGTGASRNAWEVETPGGPVVSGERQTGQGASGPPRRGRRTPG